MVLSRWGNGLGFNFIVDQAALQVLRVICLLFQAVP